MQKLLTIVTALLIGLNLQAATKTFPLTEFTQSGNTFSWTGEEVKAKRFEKLYVQVPAANVSGTFTVFGTSTNQSRFLYVYGTNGTIKDDERRAMMSANGDTIRFTPSDLTSIGTGYYLVLGTTDDFKFTRFHYTTETSDGSKATVTSILVDGEKMTNYADSVLNYTITLDYGTTTIPVVSAITGDGASVVVTQASTLPGAATVACTSLDNSVTVTYFIHFVVSSIPSSDATLKSLLFDGRPLEGFNADTLLYRVQLSYDSPGPMPVSGVVNNIHATMQVTQASGVPGVATIVVTAQDGITTRTYTVTFHYEPTIPIIRAYQQSTSSAHVTGSIGGTAHVNTQSGGRLGKNGDFFGIKLAKNKLFMEGDTLYIHATMNGGNTATLFTDAAGTDPITSQEFYTWPLLLPDSIQSGTCMYVLREDLSAIYIVRKSADCNPTINTMEVFRPNDHGLPRFKFNKEEVRLDVPLDSVSASATVKLTGRHLLPGVYSLQVPNLAGLTVSPSSVAVSVDSTLHTQITLTYVPRANTPADSMAISLTIGQVTESLTVHYSAVTPMPVSSAVITGDSTISIGEELTLTCTAADATTFQWYLNGTPISGATASTYTFTADTLGVMNFTCSASSDYTVTPVMSAVFTVNVTKPQLACGEIIKATHTGAKTANVTGTVGGSVDKNTQANGKLGSNGHYFGIKLAQGNFQMGDSLIIEASTPSSIVQVFSDKGYTMLNEGSFDANNRYIYVLGSEVEWIYLYRTTTAGSHMNPFVTSMAVHRLCIPEGSYRVLFVDWDGSVLSSCIVEEGQAATAPTAPNRTGYTFSGWDKDFSNITSNTTVTALYSINHYQVNFVDWDGQVLKSQSVEYGGTTTAPANPTREGYVFTGWDKVCSNITENTIITAQYLSLSETNIIDSGTCGNNITWTLMENGLLIISGTGTMDCSQGGTWNNSRYHLYVETVIIGDGITNIANDAFLQSYNLSQVTISSTVTSIGEEAFRECVALKSIDIPSSVITIGSDAFIQSGLTQVTIPNSVKSIEPGAFSYCENLKRVDYKAQILATDMFLGCTNLSNFTIGATVDTIKYREHVGSLSSVVSLLVPTSVKHVDSLAFAGAPNIEYHGSLSGAPWGALSLNGYVDGQIVYNNSSMQRILACSSLPGYELVIPASVTHLDNYLYSPVAKMTINCTTPPMLPQEGAECLPPVVRLIHIPAGTKQAYQNAWGTQHGQYYEPITIIYAEPTEQDIVTVVNDSLSWAFNPATQVLKLIGYGRTPDWETGSETYLPQPWANYRDIIDSVWIDPRITYLGNHSFARISSLKSLTIPETIRGMGYSLIKGSGVKTVYYNANISNVGSVISDGVINSSQGGWIVGPAHYWYPFNEADVSKLYIGKNVKTLPNLVFCGMNNVTEVTLPDSLEYIGYSAFARMNLKSISIPQTCSYIGGEAFTANDLEEIVLPDSLQYLGKMFVYANPRITEVTIPTNITQLSDSLFLGQTNLQKVHFAPNSKLKRVGICAFKDATNLIECNLPDGVTKVDTAAFYQCSSYGNYSFPDGLQEIARQAYAYTLCPDTLILPARLRALGDFAFSNDNRLKHVYVNDSLETIDYAPFGTANDKLGIHVNNLATWCRRNNREMIYNVSLFGGKQIFIDTVLLYVKEKLVNNGILRIPNDVQYIHEYAFAGINLHGATLELGDSVKTIGEYAFYATNIHSLKTNRQLTSIGENAFVDWYSQSCIMDTVLLNGDYLYIANNAFNGVSINYLLYNVRFLSSGRFERIQEVDFGNHVNTIPGGLMRGQEHLTINSWSDSIVLIGDAAFANTYVYGMPDHFPAQLIEIGNNAFKNLHRYDNPSPTVQFPQSLARIGNSAFSGCNYLQRLYFKGRTQLDEYAFQGCPNIDSIFCSSAIPAVCSASTFEGLDKFACVLTIPTGSLSLYQVATGWRDFYYMQEDSTYYIIKFLNSDSTLLQLDTLAYGSMPVYRGEDPVKPNDGEYFFVFTGWEPNIETVTGDATYIATYESHGTGVAVPNETTQPIKFWQNGKMYILLPNGQVFDSTGKRIE